MAKPRIKWNSGVFAEIRSLPTVMGILDGHAERIARNAGDGFEANPAQVTGGRRRGRASVGAISRKARKRQAEQHVLESSL